MKILSESIADYIDLNYDIESVNDIKELEQVEELVINNYNYSLDIAPFYPNELSYFKKLKKCTFINFEITDEIVDNLNKTNIKGLTLDNCTCIINKNLNIENLFIEVSNVNFKNINNLKELTILESGNIDINDIKQNNLEQLTILNTNIINSTELKKINCNIELIGCELDNEEIINELKNINYDPNKYNKI